MVTFAVKCKCLQFFRSLPMVHRAVHPLRRKFTCCKIAEQINSYKGMFANSTQGPVSGRGDYSRDGKTQMTVPVFIFIHNSPLEMFDLQCTLSRDIGGLAHSGKSLTRGVESACESRFESGFESARESRLCYSTA